MERSHMGGRPPGRGSGPPRSTEPAVRALTEQEQSRLRDLESQPIALTPAADGEAADPDAIVTVARGTNSRDQCLRIVFGASAGGGRPNPDAQAPTDAQALDDVAFEGVPWKVTGDRQAARRQVDRVEFTTSWAIAEQFGRSGVVVVQIQRRYLTKGSGTEKGMGVRVGRTRHHRRLATVNMIRIAGLLLAGHQGVMGGCAGSFGSCRCCAGWSRRCA